MKKYIATVNIVVCAESEAEACDSISACLTENLMESGAIVDWSYINPKHEPPKRIKKKTFNKLFPTV